MIRLPLTFAALALMATASFAADVIAPAPAAGDWGGYFVGVQGGGAVSGGAEFTPGTTAPGTPGEFDVEGGFGGVYYGRNWQSGNWVYGLEGSLSFGKIDGAEDLGGGADIDAKIDAFTATRAKVGYSFDDILLFVAGGFSLAHVEAEATDAGGSPLFDDSAWAKGFTFGAGADMKVSENWTARVEYLFVNYGDEDFSLAGTSGTKIDLNDLHLVRGGFSYRF